MAYINDDSTDEFGGLDPEDTDLESIDSFVEAMHEDGEVDFDWRHLAVISFHTGWNRRYIREQLVGQGLRFNARPNARRIRTIGDNPNDRWYGPGSSPMHGGSGWEQVSGFAGREG